MVQSVGREEAMEDSPMYYHCIIVVIVYMSMT